MAFEPTKSQNIACDTHHRRPYSPMLGHEMRVLVNRYFDVVRSDSTMFSYNTRFECSCGYKGAYPSNITNKQITLAHNESIAEDVRLGIEPSSVFRWTSAD